MLLSRRLVSTVATHVSVLKLCDLRYRLLIAGGGNFSTVFKGMWEGTTPVALKLLKNEEDMKEFESETAILKYVVTWHVMSYISCYRACYSICVTNLLGK